VLRRIFEVNTEESTEQWKNVHNVAPNLCSSTHIIRMIEIKENKKSRYMLVALEGEISKKRQLENVKVRDTLEDLTIE
jgi:hypothetical protein